MNNNIREDNIDKVIGLMKNEPTLNNPDELTNNIINAINQSEQLPQLSIKRSKIIRIMVRSLAAASVLLIMVFGVEQYIIIQKVSLLEERVFLTENKENISKGNLILLNTGINPAIINKLSVAGTIKSADYNLRNLITIARISAVSKNRFHRINNGSIITN